MSLYGITNSKDVIDRRLINMNGIKQLYNGVETGDKQATKTNRGTAARLSDVLGQLMDGEISPRYARLGSVIQTWERLLPAELARHCRPAEVTSGQLKVLVDSSPYMHELRLCSSQLLIELKRQCPCSRIRKIKFVIG